MCSSLIITGNSILVSDLNHGAACNLGLDPGDYELLREPLALRVLLSLFLEQRVGDYARFLLVVVDAVGVYCVVLVPVYFDAL